MPHRFDSKRGRSPSSGSGMLLAISSVILVLGMVTALRPDSVVAQITTQTALPVSTGQGIIRIQLKRAQASGSNGRQVSNLVAPVVLVYGLNARLAAFGVLPIVSRDFEMAASTGKVKRDTGGLADTRLWLRYTVHQKNGRGRTTRIAPFAGIEAPTGKTTESDALGRLPRSLQLGSGSWDPFVGLVFTHQRFAWQVDISAFYQFNSTNSEFRFGDIARLDVASKVRVLPEKLGPGLPRFLYANLETNLINLKKNHIGSIADVDSGGLIWFVAPGVQVVSRRTVFEAAVQLPIYTDMNGTALEPDPVFILSARLNM
jgi:Putative MetA-pathway of phenol degradation